LSFDQDSDSKRIRELEKILGEVLDSELSATGGNELSLINGTLGNRNDASGDSGGIRSNQPIVHTITDVDSNDVSTGIFDKINIISSMAIIDHTSTPITLKFIQGIVKDGTRIKFTPKIGKAINIESGGNILTSVTIPIADTEYLELVKHSEAETGVTGGAYKIFKTGSSGVSFPIDFPEDDRGTVGASTQDILFTDSDRHSVKIEITGDIALAFSSPPTNQTAYTNIIIVQDGVGGHSLTLPPGTVNKDTVEAGFLLGINEETGIVIKFAFGIFYAFLETGNIVSGGGSSFSGNLSDLVIDVNKDWQAQGISNIGSLTGVTGIDLDGATALIQGIKELRFFDDDPNKNIISSPNELEHHIPTLERHAFYVGATKVATINEDVSTVFELDILGHRIGDIGDFFFDLAGGNIAINRFSMEYDNVAFAARINVPVGDQFRFQEGGSTVVSFVPFVGIGYTINDSVGLFLDDATVNPLNNGEIQRNGVDVFVFSGNALRNMSNIGVAAGGADVFLSNLTSPTAINQNLNFASTLTNNITNLGNLEFENTGQSITPLSSGIRHDAPIGDAHRFRINLVDIAEINLNGIELFGNSLILDSDGDTEINSFSDDEMQFITGGGLRLTMGNTAVILAVVLSMDNLNKIINVNDPTNPQDVVTKAFGDANYLGGGEFFGPWTAGHNAGNFALTNLNNVSTVFITATNTAQFNGDVLLGNTSLDSIFFNGELATSIIPETSSIDFGDSADQFRDIYLQAGFNTSKIFFDGGGDTYLTGSGSSGRINVVSDGTNTIGFTPTALFLTDGINISVATTTGTQIATTSSQKLGFFGATPIVRPPTPASNPSAIIAALQSLGLFT